MYSMWNADFTKLKDSLTLYGRNTNQYSPFLFKTAKGELSAKFKIEDLDFLTSIYKNEDQFYQKLSQYGDTYIKNNYTKNIIITYVSKEKIKKQEVIYDDLLIYKIANEYRIKKTHKASKEKIKLDNSKHLKHFINYIENLALNEDSRKYLIGPYPHFNDRYDLELSLYLKDDIKSEGYVIHKGLRSLLKDYVFYNNIYKECLKINEDTVEAENQLEEVKKKINNEIRSNYKDIRNLIVWENKYLEVLKKEFKETEDNILKNKINRLINEVQLQKKYRNGEVSEESLEIFYEEIPEELEKNIKETQKLDIVDEDMLNSYNEGGIEQLMNDIDIDEIYSSREKMKDLERIRNIQSQEVNKSR